MNTTRKFWLEKLELVVRPVLEAARDRKLRERMPLQVRETIVSHDCSYFECAGRLICGIAPWLELDLPDGEEKDLQTEFAEMSRELIAGQVDPKSPDHAYIEDNIRNCSQFLVDAAFLAQGIMRAPNQLWRKLPQNVKDNLVSALEMTRGICPSFNNWMLFSTEIEAALKLMTGKYDPVRVFATVHQFEQWYVGDGLYSDGVTFALDYYNSFVIHPMLLDTVRSFPDLFKEELRNEIEGRAKRYAQIQERMIAPDGTFIAVGRSISYRGGVFHLLGQLALEHNLPTNISPAQVRCALTSVIDKTLTPASFREDNFLKIGLCGDQESLGEVYISTGSLYMCTTVFLPLGLAPDDSFWTSPDEKWTQKKLWDGEDLPADHKYEA